MTSGHALYSITQIRAIEQAALKLLAPRTLMLRAGAAAASAAESLLCDCSIDVACKGQPILIAAGPGNNGGDALDCAVLLARRGYPVTLFLPVQPSESHRAPAPDHVQALVNARESDLEFAGLDDLPALTGKSWALVIDGLFGIGLTRPLDGIWPAVINALNSIDAQMLALDVPSGLDADTGTVLKRNGAPPVSSNSTFSSFCIQADHTITFIGNKPGLHTRDGRDHAGTVTVAFLDIDAALYPPPACMLSTPAGFDAASHRRAHSSHKGSFGDVQVIGGSAGMTGAAILAAHAALKGGAGRVLIGFADQAAVPQTIAGHPELMCRCADGLDFSGATLVVGPGLGTSPEAASLVARAVTANAPLVLDADALNLVARSSTLQSALANRSGQAGDLLPLTLITPHPLEAARLLGTDVAKVQADRLDAASTLARKFKATVILKGSGTVVACEGRMAINPTGNPALASGGTGDVLAGLCGALLAQGWPAWEAALAATWIHGTAADRLVETGTGPVGVTATEVIHEARAVLNALIAGRIS